MKLLISILGLLAVPGICSAALWGNSAGTVYQADCSTITTGFCVDTDNGNIYVWDGDSVEQLGVSSGDNLGSATAGDVAALFTGASGYLFSDGTKKTPTPSDIGAPTTAAALVGDCTVGPCFDGSSDGGTLIKLYAGTGDKWTALQGGAPAANRSWRLPIDAAPSAGTTRLMNMDEYGQMGFVDPATFATPTGSAASMTVNASGFDGNLTTTDNTIQEIAQKLDDLVVGGSAVTDATITTTDVTTNNASTTKHGWLLKATAPSSGLRNIVAIDNGETVYKNAALFDATSPSTQAFGDTAAVGSAMTSARRDHKHAMPAAPTTITGNAGTATALAANGTNCGAGQAALGVDASGNAEGCWSPSGASAAGSDTQVQFNDGGTSFGGDAGLTYNKTTDSLTVVGTVTAGTFASSAADGSRRSLLPSNTTISPSGGGVVEIYNEGGAIKAVEADTEYDVLLSRDIGSVVQAYDADLADLADGSLTGTKVGFADTDNVWTATNVQAALEELNDSINAGAPNGAGAKVHWSQLTGVPAGFADGSDDGSGGGITHATSDGTYYASRNGAWSAFTSGNYTLAMTLTGNTAVTLPTSGTIITANSTSSLTNKTIPSFELGSAATDTTITRDSAGVVAVEGVKLTRTIASGTSALGTSAISSGACATVVTTTATGTATTDVINWGFNGDPTGVTGYAPSANGMLTIIAYPSANNVNYKVCNNTASSITPGAITLNWQVTR